MVAYVDMRDVYDEVNGQVDAPTGWFGIAGKWAITIDEQGFVHGVKWPALSDARGWFAAMQREYLAWGMER